MTANISATQGGYQVQVIPATGTLINPQTDACFFTGNLKAQVFDKDLAYRVAGDSINYPEDSLTNRWWGRRSLYLTLLELDSITKVDSVLNGFLANYKNSSAVKLDSLKFEVEKFVRDSFNIDRYDELKDELDNFSTSILMEDKMKEYANLYLDWSAGENLDEIYNAITDIAEYCVFNGGPAVLEARAFVSADSIELLHFDWEKECYTGSSPKMSFEDITEDEESEEVFTTLKALYALHPTLVKDEMQLRLSLGKDEKGILEIYSVQNYLIGRYNISEGENFINLDNTRIASGFYLYKIWVNGDEKKTGKLIIID